MKRNDGETTRSEAGNAERGARVEDTWLRECRKTMRGIAF